MTLLVPVREAAFKLKLVPELLEHLVACGAVATIDGAEAGPLVDPAALRTLDLAKLPQAAFEGPGARLLAGWLGGHSRAYMSRRPSAASSTAPGAVNGSLAGLALSHAYETGCTLPLIPDSDTLAPIPTGPR